MLKIPCSNPVRCLLSDTEVCGLSCVVPTINGSLFDPSLCVCFDHPAFNCSPICHFGLTLYADILLFDEEISAPLSLCGSRRLELTPWID
jgi:hypothetical protein